MPYYKSHGSKQQDDAKNHERRARPDPLRGSRDVGQQQGPGGLSNPQVLMGLQSATGNRSVVDILGGASRELQTAQPPAVIASSQVTKYSNEPATKYYNEPATKYYNEPATKYYNEPATKYYNEPATKYYNEPQLLLTTTVNENPQVTNEQALADLHQRELKEQRSRATNMHSLADVVLRAQIKNVESAQYNPQLRDSAYLERLRSYAKTREDNRRKGVAYEREEFPTTEYLDPLQAQLHKLIVAGGIVKTIKQEKKSRKLYERELDQKLVRDGGRLQFEDFDTTGIEGSLHPGSQDEAGSALYVLSLDNELYYGRGQVKKFHHTSVLAGSTVAAAGMIRVENGKVKWVSNSSGHYTPETKYLKNILAKLEKGGVDLASFNVVEDEGGGCDHDHSQGHASNMRADKWKALHDQPAQSR